MSQKNAFVMKNFFGYDAILPPPYQIPKDLITIYITDDEHTAETAKRLGWQETVIVDVRKITTVSERLELVCKVNCYPEEFLSKDFDNVFVCDGNVVKLDSNYGEFVKECLKSGKTLFVTSGYYSRRRNTIRAELAASAQPRWQQWRVMTNLQTIEYQRILKEKGIDVYTIAVVSAKYIGWNLNSKRQSTIDDEFFGEYQKHNQGNIILSYLASLHPQMVYNYPNFKNDGQVCNHQKTFI